MTILYGWSNQNNSDAIEKICRYLADGINESSSTRAVLHNLCLHEELCLKLIRSRGIVLVSDENENGQFAEELNNLLGSLSHANLTVGKTVFMAIMSDAKSSAQDDELRCRRLAQFA